MKKLIIALVALLGLFFVSSCDEKPSVFVDPTSMTLKVGESKPIDFGTRGGLDITGDNFKYGMDAATKEYASFDKYAKTITGVKPGKAVFVAGYFNNPDDASAAYSATCDITVTEE